MLLSLRRTGIIAGVMKIRFQFPLYPPSTNALFATFKGRRIKTRDYVAFTKMIDVLTATRSDKAQLRALAGRPFGLVVELYAPSWRYKNGNPMRFDCSNRIKAVEDCLCRAFGWLDECCVEVTAVKRIGPFKGTAVTFSFLEDVDLI